MKSSVAICLSFIATALLFCSFAVANEHETRTWTSQDGKYSIQATFVNYDYESQLVAMRRDDGEVIKVLVKRLSNSDRHYILRIIKPRKPRSETKSNSPPETENEIAVDDGDRDESNSRPKKKNKKHRPRTKPINGILWHKSIDDALATASDETRERERKPVMWFRVLGDLEGFM